MKSKFELLIQQSLAMSDRIEVRDIRGVEEIDHFIKAIQGHPGATTTLHGLDDTIDKSNHLE